MNDDINIVRDRLNEAIEESNIPIQEICKRVGIDRTALWRIRKGNTQGVKISLLKDLADILGVSAAWLFGLNVSKKPESEYHSKLRKKIEDLLYQCSDKQLEQVIAMIHIFIKEDEEQEKRSKKDVQK